MARNKKYTIEEKLVVSQIYKLTFEIKKMKRKIKTLNESIGNKYKPLREI